MHRVARIADCVTGDNFNINKHIGLLHCYRKKKKKHFWLPSFVNTQTGGTMIISYVK